MQNTKIITDESLMELIPHGTVSFPFKYYYEDILLFENHIIDWHWHKEVEFMTVLEGTVLCSIGNLKISLKKGSGTYTFYNFQCSSYTLSK
ncbi:hypothetical protein acsn021_14470 [Anaerocolumna cellulosilytica]|uniref:Uncharacterized protein n=1 Tax=Anaerocolumna cellulosilytica TaxID=433286 RepID=A0A6S6R492_9FIRM|nr:hypothetical protein [Anaerocolumna cellulosilytica]MBB5195634.1 mannose-6-phosphate isomerase-like protein (cupin superfamily) [Anaerocolumna cellulosilytica]BCJ93878.1 hypothetical protein acsn021_14470 [Anaerocolumna cellulosilytica]